MTARRQSPQHRPVRRQDLIQGRARHPFLPKRDPQALTEVAGTPARLREQPLATIRHLFQHQLVLLIRGSLGEPVR